MTTHRTCRRGLALAEAEQTDDRAARRQLHDKAIAAFRMILVNRPDLVRVRLELARVFFLKGQDGLARRHFEAVLAGGEVQHRDPFNDRLWLRIGSDTAVREYPGGDFDQFFLAAHVGPRWLAGPRTDISLLATAQRQWVGSDPYADEFGARLELDRRLGPTVWARGTAAYRRRDHLSRDFLDGPVVDFTASFAWTPAPVLRVHLTAGYTRDHAALEHWRNLSHWLRVGTSLTLPLGFTLGTSIQAQRVHYDGAG